jgi:hypothetical protein
MKVTKGLEWSDNGLREERKEEEEEKESHTLFLNFKSKVNNLHPFEKGSYIVGRTSQHIDRATIILHILFPYFFQTSFSLSPTFNLSAPRRTLNPHSVASKFQLFLVKKMTKYRRR